MNEVKGIEYEGNEMKRVESQGNEMRRVKSQDYLREIKGWSKVKKVMPPVIVEMVELKMVMVQFKIF